MFKNITKENNLLLVHLGGVSLGATKSFTHGRFVFDPVSHTLAIKDFPPLPLPDDLELKVGQELSLRLVAPDGELRPQTRTDTLQALPNGMLKFKGISKTPSRFSKDEGWGLMVYKSRAYFTHPGVKTDDGLPDWIVQSIARQRKLWNRLTGLCRDARKACLPVPFEEIRAFIDNTIFPAIDAFNDKMGRVGAKQKMKYPKDLKVPEPTWDSLWGFVGKLKGREEKNKLIPEGLEAVIRAFVEPYKANYNPINQFQDNVDAIIDVEAEKLEVRHWELRPVAEAFRSTLKRRKKTKQPFSSGWPHIKRPGAPGYDDWGIHFYFNKAGIDAMDIERGEEVRGLVLGSPLDPATTNHPAKVTPEKAAASPRNFNTRRYRPSLRTASISINDRLSKESWTYNFAVLQHRPIPEGTHVKEWKLLYHDGKLWLALILEIQNPKAVPVGLVAGMDLGWRRTDSGLTVATLHDPTRNQFKEVTLDFSLSAHSPGHADKPIERPPFTIFMGPSRKGRRAVKLNRGSGLPDTFDSLSTLRQRLDYEKDTLRFRVRKILGDQCPAWLDKAGRRGIARLRDDFADRPEITELVQAWLKLDESLGEELNQMSERISARLKDGYLVVSHEVCKWLNGHVGRLAIETAFLKQVAQEKSKEFAKEKAAAASESGLSRSVSSTEALDNSGKYRQMASLSTFVACLRNTATKYGLQVVEVDAKDTTRKCAHCGTINPSTHRLTYECEGCGKVIQQDHNAAVNIARAAVAVKN